MLTWRQLEMPTGPVWVHASGDENLKGRQASRPWVNNISLMALNHLTEKSRNSRWHVINRAVDYKKKKIKGGWSSHLGNQNPGAGRRHGDSYIIVFIGYFIYFLAIPHSMRNLSSLIRGWTHTSCRGSGGPGKSWGWLCFDISFLISLKHLHVTQ